MHGCQNNGWFLMSAPNKPFSLRRVCFAFQSMAIKVRIQLHRCQRCCRLLWGLSTLISGSSSSLFTHPFMLPVSVWVSLPGSIWAILPGWFQSDALEESIFFSFSPSILLKPYWLTDASVKPRLRFFVSLLALWQKNRRCKKIRNG